MNLTRFWGICRSTWRTSRCTNSTCTVLSRREARGWRRWSIRRGRGLMRGGWSSGSWGICLGWGWGIGVWWQRSGVGRRGLGSGRIDLDWRFPRLKGLVAVSSRMNLSPWLRFLTKWKNYVGIVVSSPWKCNKTKMTMSKSPQCISPMTHSSMTLT